MTEEIKLTPEMDFEDMADILMDGDRKWLQEVARAVEIAVDFFDGRFSENA
jgi:hypothetical protein